MSFDIEYTKLNSAQKQAVDTIDGPVMVVAGPGTGKTHVLTLRIANILRKTDANPNNILALTFTEGAAKTMRTRLISLIGKPAYGIRIETFHALADSIIREYPEFFPFEHDALPLTELECYSIIHALLDDPSLKFLRTPGSKYHYAKDIVSALSTLKREGVTPERFADVVKDETTWVAQTRDTFKKSELLTWDTLVGKHQELSSIYGKYQERLRSQSRYDFDDMLLETYKALRENELLLASLQEQFQYILVDEYQDTNGVQNALVDLLSSFWADRANLFVVGDPNQTIFRFQGALLENTLGFLDRYPTACVITLNQGYRSNQTVYDVAHRVVSSSLPPTDHPLRKTLTQILRANHTKGKIETHVTKTDTDELLFLVTKIRLLLEDGVSPGSIAVLYKKNSEGALLGDLFMRAGLPFHTEQNMNALQDPYVLQFFTLLTLLNTLTDTTEYRLLFDVLGFDWFAPQKQQLLPLTLLKLARGFSSQKTVSSPFDFVMQDQKTLKKLTTLQGVSPQEVEKVHTIGSFLAQWTRQEGRLTFPAFIELVARESGFLAYIKETQEKEAIQNYTTVFTEIRKMSTTQQAYRLTDFLTYLNTMQKENLKLSSMMSNNGESVTLSTVHKAKGKEWAHVFLPFFHEGYWGKVRGKHGLALPEGIITHPQSVTPESDERHLLFVALTRAKESVYISYAQEHSENGVAKARIESPFTTDIATAAIPFQPEENLQHLFIEPAKETYHDADVTAWLTLLTEHLPLSASSLNTYLEDPQLFFERFLLKLPQAPQPHLVFGTAIHAALDFMFSTYKQTDNTYPPLEKVLAVFRTALKRQILTQEDQEIRLAQGTKVLTAYREQAIQHFPHVVATEESFGWKRGHILLGDIELTGKIDRIDLTSDGKLRVIDYKTGKSKTIGDIEGTTKASGLSARELTLPPGIRGRMKRQLLFYKLLLSLDPQYKRFSTQEGVFVFVEPHQGKFVERTIPLTTEDVHDLKTLIREVVKEIRSLTFLTQKPTASLKP